MQDQIKQLIDTAQRIVIMQADNPDGDSLGSAVALEHILGDMGKEPLMYCGVDIPSYLHYIEGWDRVQNTLSMQFDLTIVVDTAADSLFETLNRSNSHGWVASKPCLVIDHHGVEPSIPYATLVYDQPAVATAEVIYELAQTRHWPLSVGAKKALMAAMMSDSLGLTSEGTSARSIAIVSELVAGGVSIAQLESARRNLQRKSAEIIHYKGELLQRVEFHDDNHIATITIPWTEIERYSQAYNPSMLVLDEMRYGDGTDIGIAFKLYKDGKITAKIRCNYGKGIAADLAMHFGGGGHRYASGFKITNGRPFDEIKSESIRVASELLDTLEKSVS